MRFFPLVSGLLLLCAAVPLCSAADAKLPPPAVLEPGTIERDRDGNIVLVPPADNPRKNVLTGERLGAGRGPSSRNQTKPGRIIFQDNFEYQAGRDNRDALAVFQQHGWHWAKTHQVPESGRHPLGYVYTTDTIPGSTTAFPGRNSSRVLALEALPTSLGNRESGYWGDMQTDFYLQYGDGSMANAIPANVWFKFWIYPTGNFDRTFKFIYPCNGGYPCYNLKWLFTLGTTSQEPHWIEAGVPGNRLYLGNKSGGPNYRSSQEAGTYWHLGQTNVYELLPANRWTKVILHYDTSQAQGLWEAWLQPLNGEMVKVVEWIGGVTPNFEWNIETPGGHRVFRMPTTIGGPAATRPDSNFDSIYYIDDFIMATSNSALGE